VGWVVVGRVVVGWVVVGAVGVVIAAAVDDLEGQEHLENEVVLYINLEPL